jgi:acyl-CoA synthetase (NDP forming)
LTAAVVEVARACGALGLRALVIVSAGFAEVGAAGVARQRELLAVCRAAGMRVVGPNCLGVLNTDPAISMNATFAPGTLPAGTLAFASQSGAFGIAAIDLAAERSLGLSSFVSAGDKADLSGNDFLQFWEIDERTGAIVLYLESFGNPRKFGQIARRVSSVKPVIAVTSGRSAAGQRAASAGGPRRRPSRDRGARLQSGDRGSGRRRDRGRSSADRGTARAAAGRSARPLSTRAPR